MHGVLPLYLRVSFSFRFWTVAVHAPAKWHSHIKVNHPFLSYGWRKFVIAYDIRKHETSWLEWRCGANKKSVLNLGTAKSNPTPGKLVVKHWSQFDKIGVPGETRQLCFVFCFTYGRFINIICTIASCCCGYYYLFFVSSAFLFPQQMATISQSPNYYSFFTCASSGSMKETLRHFSFHILIAHNLKTWQCCPHHPGSLSRNTWYVIGRFL